MVFLLSFLIRPSFWGGLQYVDLSPLEQFLKFFLWPSLPYMSFLFLAAVKPLVAVLAGKGVTSAAPFQHHHELPYHTPSASRGPGDSRQTMLSMCLTWLKLVLKLGLTLASKTNNVCQSSMDFRENLLPQGLHLKFMYQEAQLILLCQHPGQVYVLQCSGLEG